MEQRKAERTVECLALRQVSVLTLREQAGLVSPHDALEKPCVGLQQRRDLRQRWLPGEHAKNRRRRIHTYVEEECLHG